MARFDRMAVLNEMLRAGLLPIFYNPDVEVAKKVIAACADGGSRIVEFTNRGDRALSAFTRLAEWAERERPEVILGVGSVVDAPTAALYVGAGANFVVSPVLNPEVARLCNRRKVAHLPGCGTVSEISQAEELGCEIVKIFPAGEMGGAAFVKAVLGPMPWTRILPAGGVDATAQSVTGWIRAGAVRDTVREVLRWIQEARQG